MTTHTTQHDRYCLVVRRALSYAVVYEGPWARLLDEVAVQRAQGVSLENLRTIPFSDSRRVMHDAARSAFRVGPPVQLTCPVCHALAPEWDGEGACVCENGHYFWPSSAPEAQAALDERAPARSASARGSRAGASRTSNSGPSPSRRRDVPMLRADRRARNQARAPWTS